MKRLSGGWARVEGARWMAGRGRNVVRRPALVGVVAGVVFLVSLLALVLIPRGATRAAQRVAPRPDERADTLAAVQAIAAAQRVVAESDAALARARATHVPPPAPPPPVDTFPPHLVARRDSLAAAVLVLGEAIARAEQAPLPSSYRSLGASSHLAAVPRVRVLLDSLAAVEREREAFGALGGADPMFVALTERLTEIGRELQSIAAERRTEMRRQAQALRPQAPPPPPPLAPVDTAPYVVALAAARAEVAASQRALAAARQAVRDYDARMERARELANVAAPPLARLAAALVLGLVAGFAAALLHEGRRPRVADAREAEHVAGVRVLATVRPRQRDPERMRRRADQVVSALLDPTDDQYRLLYLHFAASGSQLPLVTVTGEESDLVAVIGANLAAAAAYDARSTLLVDADLTTSGGVAGVMRLHHGLGLAGVLTGALDWAEAIASTVIGRDRTLDVIPAGVAAGPRVRPSPANADQRRELARLARRYDLTVVVAPFEHARNVATSVLPSPDVLVVARVAHTPLARLGAIVDDLRSGGLSVHGIVLWDAPLPAIPQLERDDEEVRRARAATEAQPVEEAPATG